uniref:Uncharacterized protein n=1 Tax=Chrysotila carterae TaxID=13221 RepID=A0A7S4C4R4_CHRCT
MAPLPNALASLLACAAGADALIASARYTGSTHHPAALRQTRCTGVSCVERIERRAVVGSCLGALAGAFLSPSASEAMIESNNPANNYYFPMAKYRYLPRIFRAWIASSELAPKALEERDWEGLRIVYERLDDATLAMPLYTSAVEGSRSTKRKKKSEVCVATKAFIAFRQRCARVRSPCSDRRHHG